VTFRLRTLLGDHKCTAALKNGSLKSDVVAFDFVEYSPTNKGFKPMVREAAFDVAEMAIVTYLMAKAFDKPMVLLPSVVLARFQRAFQPPQGSFFFSGGNKNDLSSGLLPPPSKLFTPPSSLPFSPRL